MEENPVGSRFRTAKKEEEFSVNSSKKTQPKKIHSRSSVLYLFGFTADKGLGYFLTDARTHRGSSGAPVVMRSSATDEPLPWKLLGVHSARMDMGGRDLQLDETLGLNCAWYADILLTLTV